MQQYWQQAEHIAALAETAFGHALLAAATFLEADNAVSRLTKDTVTAVVITAISSLVIGGLVAIHQSRRRAKIRMPIRMFVLEAVASAHSGIREAIAAFDETNGKRLKTRLKRLGDQIAKVRGTLSPTVVAGFGFFEVQEQTAIAAYLADIKWVDVTTIDDAVARLMEIDAKYRNVTTACNSNDAAAWDRKEFMAIQEDLKRLPTGSSRTATGPAQMSAQPAEGANGQHEPLLDPATMQALGAENVVVAG